MAKPLYDYDGDDFYYDILTLAMQGNTDAEIADLLADGRGMDPEVFTSMKNGNYSGWNAQQNATRGLRISKALARGRRKNLQIIRGAYLRAALGGKKLRNKSTTIVSVYGPDGEKITERESQRVEQEIEQAPNMQALATLLYNHDPEWRRMQKGLEATDVNPEEIKGGVDIAAWIRKEASENVKAPEGDSKPSETPE